MNDAEVFAIIGELANQDAGRIASLGFPEKKKEEIGISSVPDSQSWQFATANTCKKRGQSSLHPNGVASG